MSSAKWVFTEKGSAMLAAAVLALPSLLLAAGPVPADRVQWIVEPDRPATIRWRGELPPDATCAVRDYWGRTVATLPVAAGGEGEVIASGTWPQGFYELELTGAAPVGLVAAPQGTVRDGFFAIDAAMSWLVGDEATRRDLVAVLARCGIAMARERTSWSQIEPQPGRWEWDAHRRYETLRRAYDQAGVPVLEMFHDAPAWTERVVKYPGDLAAAARSWEAIAARWRPHWGALEVWNEPDISFGGDLPADQYVPLVRAVRFGLGRGRIDVPVLGGVFATRKPDYLDNAARNGLLDEVDVLSFHTYDRAPSMEKIVADFRAWMDRFGRASVPLWITECGRPWKKGTDRPAVEPDAASALDIAMKAVEARACGVERYFAFVYPFYEENDNNFGMMDRRQTPLRGMAAYANLARVLAGKRYVGDLAGDDPRVQRARVFADAAGSAVAVLYTGKTDPQATLRVPVAFSRCEGIDGRTLTATADGAIPVPDGLVFVGLEGTAWREGLRTDTEAMRLAEIARREAPAPVKPGSVVLRYAFDTAAVTPSSQGYHLQADPPGLLPLRVRAFQLADEPRRVDLRLRIPGAPADAVPAEVQHLAIPAAGSADAVWTLDARRCLSAAGRMSVEIEAADAGGTPLTRLALDFHGEPDLARLLAEYPRQVKLPIAELPRWRPAIVGHGRMTLASTPEAAWRLEAHFGEGDRWVYPRFALPEEVDLARFSGLLIRARAAAAGTVRVFLWEGDTGVGYLTPGTVVPADGRWHTALVPFDQLTLSGANAPDANQQLDLSQVRALSLGMNSDAADNTLEVAELHLVGSDGQP